MPATIPSLSFPSAYPTLNLTANLRQEPKDFQVTEVLGFEPSGHGEHHLVSIEKTGQNTQWVAGQLAKFVGLKPFEVGYCGRKDRHAVTTQWFSLHMPGQNTPDWSTLNIPGCTVKAFATHHKKLRPGTHEANMFKIRLAALRETTPGAERHESITTGLASSINAETSEQQLIERLNTIATQGVPNYFGYQRFGNNGQNLLQAERWLLENKSPRRDQRGIILSSARAYLFNLVLASRVKQDTWQHAIPGDALIDSLPSGPLWGRGRSTTQADALAAEQAALAPYANWLDSLEHKGLSQERRRFCLKPEAFQFTLDAFGTPDASLTLQFQLVTGAFATTVLAEIVNAVDCAAPSASNAN